MDEVMIKIDKVSKEYKLGQIGGTTLRDELQRRRAKRRGLEDPTRKIGARQYKDGETFMALDGVSFTVRRGERVGIIGRNGAGKSTLLKLLCRVTAPTDGFIGLNGRIASMLEVGTGFHPELTGRENIYMNGAILGMTKKEIDRKIEDIIEFSEVRQFIDTPVKRYSSGMYVKLAFSVAAHLDSEIMIMDEVLAVGDMAFQKKCLEKMSDVSKSEGRTILYVSHNMNTIRQLCDRVIVLDHGHVIFDGGVSDGIAVYMNSTSDDRIVYDYRDYPRTPRNVRMLKLEITNHNSNILLRGDNICFSLYCLANSAAKNVGYRLEVFFSDGTVVGTMFSDPIVFAEEGGLFKIDMEMSTSHLAPGRYTCAGLLYEADQYGNQVSLDRVYPALSFELTPANTLVWLHQWWGHVVLDPLRISEIEPMHDTERSLFE